MKNPKHWDIFCKVIDNFGDIGVCWRLCCDLVSRGAAVRLWLDDPSALQWMAPQGNPGVQVVPWHPGWYSHWHLGEPWPDVVVESFGCAPDPYYLAQWDAVGAQQPQRRPPVWINLEYLSAESYVERSHGLPSRPAEHVWLGQNKYFFYPGFTPSTGGLIRELNLADRRARFDAAAFLTTLDPLASKNPTDDQTVHISLFCYKNAPVQQVIQALIAQEAPSSRMVIYVTPGQAQQAAMQAQACTEIGLAAANGRLRWVPLNYLTQTAFDQLLWACDFNFIRGEDSLVRALWAQKPFLWHIYQQQDASHFTKLEAFLRQAQLPQNWADWMRHWNEPLEKWGNDWLQALRPAEWKSWRPYAHSLSQRLQRQTDLASQLIQFVAERQ